MLQFIVRWRHSRPIIRTKFSLLPLFHYYCCLVVTSQSRRRLAMHTRFLSCTDNVIKSRRYSSPDLFSSLIVPSSSVHTHFSVSFRLLPFLSFFQLSKGFGDDEVRTLNLPSLYRCINPQDHGVLL